MDNVEKAGDLTCKRFFLLNHVEKVWIDFGKITCILVLQKTCITIRRM